MKWKKYTLATTTEAVDLISATLGDLGVEGIEIEDHIPLTAADTKGIFMDSLPDPGPDDGSAKVSFYLEESEKTGTLLTQIRSELEDLRLFTDPGSLQITESETEDKDWINNWKQYFKPFCVDDILIKPTWEEIPKQDQDKLLIQIDPGTAFGTGQHETTQLCIRQIRRYLQPGMRILDVGTGSGILGITALKLGAGYAFGTDLDDNAIQAVYENMRSNAIEPKQFTVVCGNIIDDRAVQEAAGMEAYDLVAANILAPVIIELQKEVFLHMKHGAILITSGIINTWEEAVKDALLQNPELEILETTYQGEWVSVTCRRK